nr:PREDICTED: beta-1,3-galactosyltransferase brn [Bemisia tabaci]
MISLIPKLLRRRRNFLFLLCSLAIAHFFGAFTHPFELDYHTTFSYPLDIDIKPCVNNLKTKIPSKCPIINSYNYSYLSSCESKCQTVNGNLLRLVYIVKSKVDNFEQRAAIRKSWGFEKRFSDVPIRTVFILGVEETKSTLQKKVEEESKIHNDIVQADFIDTYFNNTIKTMMGIQWAVRFCKNSKFYFFSDDDMYVSTKNVLRFIRNPVNYPDYLENPIISLQKVRREKRNIGSQMSSSVEGEKTSFHDQISSSFNSLTTRNLKQVLDFELPDDVKLFAGYVFFSSPHRHYPSKWYVTLAEYPFHMWPPYVTAGSYVLSFNALTDLYFASFFTKHFRFDDIYLGLLAKKMDLEPFHCDEFHFYKKAYNHFNYRYVITSHGYDDPDELLKVWNEQKSAGNA